MHLRKFGAARGILASLWLVCAMATPLPADGPIPRLHAIGDACRTIKGSVEAGERVSLRLHGLRIASGRFDRSIFISHGLRLLGTLSDGSRHDVADCIRTIETIYRSLDLTSEPP
ncbi:hypothetical protein [Phreatobacter stygius]|uniref:Uncharacterized protein n=1 Tax=Phreatobacter stygius TaxID=1940610 RepID=A0A4D7B8B0_9HYPH|nr:hypothetical protein [Phreatobacter stygius]QCI67185.1 hypothetical protein E8M01_24890 [Phreatobacter stygius]